MTAEDSPFDSPLSLEEWTRALHRGLGRAVLDVRRFGVREGMADALIDACVHDRVFDGIEGTHADWLCALAADMLLIPRVLEAVIEATYNESDVRPFEHHLLHRELLFELAKRGHDEAIDCLRQTLRFECSEDVTPYGFEELLAFDAESALLQTLTRLGGMGELLPRKWLRRDVLEEFDAIRGKGTAFQLLQAHSGEDPRLERVLGWLRSVPEDQESDAAGEPGPGARPDPPGTDWTLEQVLECIVDPGESEFPYPLRVWSRRRTTQQMARLEEEFLQLTRPIAQLRCLSAMDMAQQRSAVSTSVITRAVDLAESPDDRLAFRARRFLREVEDPRVRALAWSWIERERWDRIPFELLLSNYESADLPRVQQALESCATTPDQDLNTLHWSIDAVYDLLERHPDPKGSETLIWSLPQTPCAICRTHIVELLEQRGALSGGMREELAHDCYEPIREIVDDSRDSNELNGHTDS